jgi:hypothetical protein
MNVKQDIVALGLLVVLGLGAFILGNAVANRLSKPIEGSGIWRDVFGRQ